MRHLPLFFVLVNLCACATYQNTTHSFTYHGTDGLGLDQDFFISNTVFKALRVRHIPIEVLETTLAGM